MHRHATAALLGALMLTTTHTAPADDAFSAAQVTQDAQRFARARGADARDLLLGTPRARAIAPTGLDCDQLYQQRVALMHDRLDPGPTDYYSDPRVGAASFVGAVWTPGFYYLPFRALQNFRDQSRRPQREAELDALRQASAAQRCYER